MAAAAVSSSAGCEVRAVVAAELVSFVVSVADVKQPPFRDLIRDETTEVPAFPVAQGIVALTERTKAVTQRPQVAALSDSPALAAERGRDAADRLGNPVLIGFAARTQARALSLNGAHRRAENVLSGVIDNLAGVDPTGPNTLAAEAYGYAHLRGGLIAAQMGQGNAAYDHLGEAARIAMHTGERNGLHQHFGQSYVAIMRLRVGIELQEAGRAYERAHTANIEPARLGAHNTVNLHLYSARALAQEGGRRDADAAEHLNLAERHGPHRVRHLPMALELLAELKRRAPRIPSCWTPFATVSGSSCKAQGGGLLLEPLVKPPIRPQGRHQRRAEKPTRPALGRFGAT